MIPADSRGQSNTLAIAMVMVLALTGALLITGIGSVTLGESKQVAETQQAVRAMTEFDSRASLVALEGGSAATIPFQDRGTSQVTVRQSGQIKLLLRNDTTTRVLENTTLGAVVYENGKSRIAYQGGGVWRRPVGSNRSIMVSPPEVHYNGGTLTLPMIQIQGDERGIGTARIEKVGTNRVYPVPSKGANWSNPVPTGYELELVIQSDYYRGWATFFERRIGASVTVFDENQTAHVTLVAKGSDFKVDSGLISVGTSAPIDMQGNAGAPTFVDSYDSRGDGNYSNSHGKNGTVRSPGGIDLGGNSYIKGNVNTASTLTFGGSNNTIYGNARHQGMVVHGKATITGWEAENGTDVEIIPIDETVNTRVNTICANAPSIPDNGTLVSTTYCHQGDLELTKETLTIDLSDGNVSLAVDGDLVLTNDAEIEVVNRTAGHTAKLWLGGDRVELTSSSITVPNETAPAFRLYGKSGTSVSMKSQSRFVGLLYAPTQPGAGGTFSMRSGSHLYGSAVVGEVEMKSGSAVHYDQALGGFSFQRSGTPVSRLSYLHVTINEVRVTER